MIKKDLIIFIDYRCLIKTVLETAIQKQMFNFEMLLQCLVVGSMLGITAAWDKDNSQCQLNYEVNVTKEALCCQSLQPNKACFNSSREADNLW